MGQVLEFRVEDSYRDRIAAEADELNLSRAAYVQMMFEAGRRLFQASGKLDTDALAALVNEDGGSFQSDNELAEIEDDLANTILSKLPADPNRPATKEEVRKMVFGTKKEQLSEVDDALKALYDRDEIDSAYEGGYYNE